eukprot:superscaffoldBa00005972_g20993
MFVSRITLLAYSTPDWPTARANILRCVRGDEATIEKPYSATGSFLQHADDDSVRFVTLTSYLASPEGTSTCLPSGHSETLSCGQDLCCLLLDRSVLPAEVLTNTNQNCGHVRPASV